MHNCGFSHRDIKDDNFLIRRKEGCLFQGMPILFIIEIAVCDFGMTGYIKKPFSLPNY